MIIISLVTRLYIQPLSLRGWIGLWGIVPLLTELSCLVGQPTVEHNLLFGHLYDGSVGRWWFVCHVFLPLPYPTPLILVKVWVRINGGFNCFSRLCWPLPPVQVQACPYLLSHGPDARLILYWLSEKGKPGFNDAPGILRYSCSSPPLGRGEVGRRPYNINEN